MYLDLGCKQICFPPKVFIWETKVLILLLLIMTLVLLKQFLSLFILTDVDSGSFFRLKKRVKQTTIHLKNKELIQFSQMLGFFLFENYANTKDRWQLFQGKHKKELATASRRSRSFREWLKSTSPKFQRKLKAGSIKKSPRNLAEGSQVFWVLCSKLMNFFWTCNYGVAPEPFQELPGTITSETGNPLGIVPRMILIPAWSALFFKPAIQLTRTRRRLLTDFWNHCQIPRLMSPQKYIAFQFRKQMVFD